MYFRNLQGKDSTLTYVSNFAVLFKEVGCDWVVDSLAKEDDCGICHGDGTTCDRIEGFYDKQNLSPGYKEIVVIPSGSRNIKIFEKEPSQNYISISSTSSKTFYLNGKR